VCRGYSKYLHCAITLFEALADKIESWSVGHERKCWARITGNNGSEFSRSGDCMSVVIAEVARDFLKAEVRQTVTNNQ
jgi:head-tail adaptor